MFMTIMDSMTDKELDCPNPKVLQEQSRVMRVARGAGCNPYCVLELLGARPYNPKTCCTHLPVSKGSRSGGRLFHTLCKEKQNGHSALIRHARP